MKDVLRIMAGSNEAQPLTGLFQGIDNLKDEVNQLYSEVNNDN